MAFNNIQKCVLQTLLYSDIFDFPMTDEELWRGLITDRKINKRFLKKTAEELGDFVVFDQGYYSLRGQEKNIEERVKRVKITSKKMRMARVLVERLAYIPTIYFVGVTGRLSHNDADQEDDIDLIFITRKNTLWMTRLLVLMVLEYLKVRRKYNDRNPSDKICPNLFIDETVLGWDKKKRDLYTAHEIVHIYPLLNRKNIYQRFINKNKWIRKYFANFSCEDRIRVDLAEIKTFTVLSIFIFLLTLPPIEYAVKWMQGIYMKRKITTETILANFLAFHPHDARPEILSNFEVKIKQFEINK